MIHIVLWQTAVRAQSLDVKWKVLKEMELWFWDDNPRSADRSFGQQFINYMLQVILKIIIYNIKLTMLE